MTVVVVEVVVVVAVVVVVVIVVVVVVVVVEVVMVVVVVVVLIVVVVAGVVETAIGVRQPKTENSKALSIYQRITLHIPSSRAVVSIIQHPHLCGPNIRARAAKGPHHVLDSLTALAKSGPAVVIWSRRPFPPPLAVRLPTGQVPLQCLPHRLHVLPPLADGDSGEVELCDRLGHSLEACDGAVPLPVLPDLSCLLVGPQQGCHHQAQPQQPVEQWAGVKVGDS